MPQSSQRVAVKICGITNLRDAIDSITAGADMLGFNFYKRSRRFIPAQLAGEIIAELRQRGTAAQCVGVFVDAETDSIRQICAQAGLDAVQLHGNEPPDECYKLQPLHVIKALRVHAGFDPAVVANFDCETILLDSWNANEAGGTGASFDWRVAAEIRRRVKRLILAGGLHADNVAEAIRAVSPDAVDVCSGVEDSPGQKSSERIGAFIAAVRSVAGANAPAPERVIVS